MRKSFRLLSTAVLLACLVAALFPQSSTQAAFNNVLHITLTEPVTIDPAKTSYPYEDQIVFELFSGLIQIDPATGEAEPGLAESWVWNSDGTEIIFTLRSSLTWSDGHPLTASDARYGILRSLAIDGPYASMLDPILNAQAYREGTVPDSNQVGVYVDSSTTLRIKLNRQMAFFEKVLNLSVARPVPEHVITAHPGDWTSPAYIAASGPYTLMDWQPKNLMRLIANTSYYGAAPFIPQVDILFGMTADALWDAYLTGRIDTMDQPATRAGMIAADSVLKAGVISTQNYCTFAVKFNTSSAPFNKLKVRQAFTAAIDRQAFIKDVLVGAGIPAQTFIPPGIFGYVDGAAAGVGIPSDVAQAQGYLSTAGYPGGAGFPAVTVQAADTARSHAVWDYLAGRWMDVLNVQITVNYVATIPIPQPMIYSGWCADYNEGYNFLNDAVSTYKSGGFVGTWSNPSYDALMMQIARTPNPASRLPLYRQAEEILTETDTFLAPIYVSVTKNLTQLYLDRQHTGLTQQLWHLWSIHRTKTTTYSPDTAQTFTPSNDFTTYLLPVGLFPQDATIRHTVLHPEDLIDLPPNTTSFGDGFEFYYELLPASLSPQVLSEQTSQPYQISVAYSPRQLTAGGIIRENTLALYAYVNGKWVRQTSTVNTITHTLTATTSQINTMFAILSTQYSLYIPTLHR